MSATWTTPPWCPPCEDGPHYWWTIAFQLGKKWIPQCVLVGGPPTGVDLGKLLRDWFERRGGPDALWRLQVTARDDDAVAGEVTAELSGWIAPEPLRLGRPARSWAGGSFAECTVLLPPTERQLAARRERGL